MLVTQWDAMSWAIPRVRADDSLDMYTAVLAASPNAGKAGQKLVDEWWRLVLDGPEIAARAVRVSWHTFGRVLHKVLESYSG
jgi:hypothetical protein